MKMLLSVIAVLALFSGCLDFGKDEETMNPTAQQIEYCRKIMHIRSDLKIIPLGYKLIGSGIDAAVYFKFETTADSVSRIFDSACPFSAEHNGSFVMDKGDGPQWWDVEGRNLTGGHISLPGAKYMDVGIHKQKKGCTVYIFWFETLSFRVYIIYRPFLSALGQFPLNLLRISLVSYRFFLVVKRQSCIDAIPPFGVFPARV